MSDHALFTIFHSIEVFTVQFCGSGRAVVRVCVCVCVCLTTQYIGCLVHLDPIWVIFKGQGRVFTVSRCSRILFQPPDQLVSPPARARLQPLFISAVFFLSVHWPPRPRCAVISEPCIPQSDRLSRRTPPASTDHGASYLPFILFGSDFVPFIILIGRSAMPLRLGPAVFEVAVETAYGAARRRRRRCQLQPFRCPMVTDLLARN